jgi:hypothetical protein
MRPLRIYFTDFWGGFNPEKGNIGYAMRQVFPEAIYLTEPIDVDLCVYSVFGNQHQSIDARYRISYQGEPGPSLFGSTDLAIGFDFPKNSKEFRCPIWKLGLYENHEYDISRLKKYTEPRITAWKNWNTIPIGAVYSNPRGFRCEMIPILAQQRLCASYGGFYRTHLPQINDKEYLVRQHPFHLSFEAVKQEGYVSEKLKDALLNDSLPFYWGDTRGVREDFNPEAFFDISHFNEGDGSKAYHFMMDVMKDTATCEAMRKAPVFKEIPDMNPLYDAIRNVIVGYD